MKTALWRRVSTDDYYIVKKVKEGYFLEGTQNHNTFEECVKEIEKKGETYIEYTILPRIYRT